MSLLIKLGIYAAIFTAVAFAVHTAWTGFKTSIAAPYVQAQIRSDQPKIDAAERLQKAAEDARDTARGNVTACEAAKKRQDDARAESDAQTARNFAAAEKSRSERAKREAAGAAHEAELRVIAAAKPKIEACEQERDLAKATLRDMLKARRGAER